MVVDIAKTENPERAIWDLLETVTDPEIPVISVVELGIVRSVEKIDEEWVVTITPTYSGCPAMNMIETQIRMLMDHDLALPYRIETVLDPPWTTDWMSEDTKAKLKAYGIAPPQASPHQAKLFGESRGIECPQCSSKNTELISQFGSTACKAMYRCKDCLEPFDYFKCY